MAAELVELAYHNQSLPPYQWGADHDELASLIEGTPYANYEVVLNGSLQEAIRLSKPGVDQTVKSLHASFNNGNDLYGRIADWQKIQRADRTMDLLQAAHVLRPGMTVVGYADSLTDETTNFILDNGLQFIAQPTGKMYAEHGNIQLRNRGAPLGSRAIKGYCADTTWITVGISPEYAAKAWRHIAQSGEVYEGHVSTNRWDVAPIWSRKSPHRHIAKETREDYETMLHAPQKIMDRRLGKMVVQLVNEWVPPEDVEQRNGQPVLRLVTEFAPENPFGIRNRHIKFAENLAELLGRETDAAILPGRPAVSSNTSLA